MNSRSRPDEHHVVLQAGSANHWKRFSSPVEVIRVDDVDLVIQSLESVEQRVNREGLFAAGFLSYEAAPAFDSAMRVLPAGSLPLLWFGLYDTCEDASTPFSQDTKECELGEWEPKMTRAQYSQDVNTIRNHIAEGDTYQINYSFRMRSHFLGDPRGLFLDLVQSQQSRYSAFIETQDFVVCSVSPELFFSLNGDRLISKPMKGTAKRGRTQPEDVASRDQLKSSEKNRAENLMIVDMVRNDFGQVAVAGSIGVEEMFALERYPTVWQMTSTVFGKSEASLSSIMKALFPCASITGAPKIRSMEIISELESTPRGVYTGCIGFMSPRRQAQFNVAIRTLVLDRKTNVAEYGVGGGIVWGSNDEDEFAECLSKARVLTDRMPQFELLETLLWTPEEQFFLLDYHIDRLKSSAEYFGFVLDEKAIVKELETISSGFRIPQKIRLMVARNGRVRAEPSTYEPMRNPVRVRFAKSPVDTENAFFYHKTTNRRMYANALVGASEVDDVILWNPKGQVTESTIANVVVEINGKLVTPPVECGLLGGTFRRLLLEQGKIHEQSITVAESKNAKSLFLINSVSRWRKALLVAE